MLGAIYTGMSGMDAYSEGLQTISNNVANLNTSGFKEQNVALPREYPELKRKNLVIAFIVGEAGHHSGIGNQRVSAQPGARHFR